MTRRSLYPLAVTAPGWRTVHAARHQYTDRGWDDTLLACRGGAYLARLELTDAPVTCGHCLRITSLPLRPHERGTR